MTSLRFIDLSNLLELPTDAPVAGTVTISEPLTRIDFSSTVPTHVIHPSSQWFVNDEIPVGQPEIELTKSIPVQSVGQTVETSETPETVNTQDTTATGTATAQPTDTTVVWTRAEMIKFLRRLEIDLMPKVVYAESPTVTALIRSDVNRYLEFVFVTRLLAYTCIQSNPDTAGVAAAKAETDEQGVNDKTTAIQSSVIQIPVGRSEMFKTRLLSLRQKRSLGIFFDWCAHLSVDPPTTQPQSDAKTTCAGELDENYHALVDRPFHEFLEKQNCLDEFAQQLVLTNLAFSLKAVTTRQAIQRIRQLLLSMNRFGPHPLLWPMYGCGDLPQAFSRMSAVFGTTFCLNTSVASIRRSECDQGDGRHTGAQPSDDNQASTSAPRDFLVCLSEGHIVHASCVVIGADQVTSDWLSPQVNRWCVRAVLITDRSIHPEGRKDTDVSLLTLPFSVEGGEDPVVLLELPIHPPVGTASDRQLFLVHLTATVAQPVRANEALQLIVYRFFEPYDEFSQVDGGPPTKPRLLWAGYFSLPDLSDVDSWLNRTKQTRFDDCNGLFLAPGADPAFHLDNTVVASEQLFNRLVTHLHIPRPHQPVQPPPSIDATAPGPEAVGSEGAYISLEARWDGLFPPRPPRQEELLLNSLTVGGEEATVTAGLSAEPTEFLAD